MGVRPEARKKTGVSDRDTEIKTKLFYLFFIAQICAIFGMVVGVLFFILRFFRIT